MDVRNLRSAGLNVGRWRRRRKRRRNVGKKKSEGTRKKKASSINPSPGNIVVGLKSLNRKKVRDILSLVP